MPVGPLVRRPAEGKIAGVCAGIADYFAVDVVLVRSLWVVLSIVPGAIIGGVLAYLGAWLVMPESPERATAPVGARLTRSNADRKIAGVCGGIAEYFNVDATAVRLVWIVLSIFGGAVVGGVIAYVAAWAVMPPPANMSLSTSVPAATA